jgi:hypothetical protein
MATDEIQMRGDVSLSTFPGVLTDLHGAKLTSGPGAEALSAGEAAMKQVYVSMGAAIDANKKLGPKPADTTRPSRGLKPVEGTVFNRAGHMVVPSGHEAVLDRELRRVFERTVKSVQQNVGVIENSRAELEKEVAKALVPPSTSAAKEYGAEIRTHVKSLGATRYHFVSNAIASGQREVAAAVLNGPSFLSGLKDDEVAQLREEASAKFAPDQHAALQAVKKVEEHVKTHSGIWARDYGLLFPPQVLVDRAQRGDKAVAALKEAVNG